MAISSRACLTRTGSTPTAGCHQVGSVRGGSSFLPILHEWRRSLATPSSGRAVSLAFYFVQGIYM